MGEDETDHFALEIDPANDAAKMMTDVKMRATVINSEDTGLSPAKWSDNVGVDPDDEMESSASDDDVRHKPAKDDEKHNWTSDHHSRGGTTHSYRLVTGVVHSTVRS